MGVPDLQPYGPRGPTDALAAILKRDRAVVAACCVALIAIAWLYLLRSPMPMDAAMPMATPVWNAAYFASMFAMWAVMMVAMMLPSAAPMLLLYAAAQRRAAPPRAPFTPVILFAFGYLACWAGFSLLAVLLQWALASLMLITPGMTSASPWLTGGLFVAAGLYELTGLKHACLSHCRSPLHFFLHRNRPGAKGAFLMGLEHGAYCVGCCWATMLLLFALGVMNLLWVAVLALVVLAEKLLPHGVLIARIVGSGFLAAGLAVATGLLLA